jgi:small GTP-binding protein
MKDRRGKTSFKVVVVGATSVGKSSMVERLIGGSFSNELQSTVGVEIRSFQVQLDDHAIKLQIWDTAGQERFRSVSTSYFRDAVGAILVYDITNEDSFEDLGTWLTDLQQLCHPNAFVMLVGNKCDCEAERKVGIQQVQDFADQYRLEYIETSAKSGHNIQKIFTKLAYGIACRVENGEIEVVSPSPKEFSLRFQPPPEETKGTCAC